MAGLLIFVCSYSHLFIFPFCFSIFWAGLEMNRTGYDAATRQHWLSATRPDYQGRFLLHQSDNANTTNKTPTIDTIVHKFNNPTTERCLSPEEDEIRKAVDDMICVMPPPPRPTAGKMVSSRR